MKISFNRTRLSASASTLSAAAGLLCGIHCAALPVATTALMVLGISPFSSAWAEVAVMLSAAGIALLTFWPRATRDGNAFPLQLALLSAGFFLASWQMAWLAPLLRQSLSVSAGLLLLLAHAQNLWTTRHFCPRPIAGPQCR